MEEPKSTPSTPHLANREAFERALANYQMSDHARQVLAETKLILLTGPSSAGRNTIIDFMIRSGKYRFVVSDTTRSPRTNNGILEQNGREYWFRDEAEMLQEIKDGEFLEAEIIHGQQVSGISIRELEEAASEGKIPINEVDIGGMLSVMAAKPDVNAIVVLPPNFDEWQRRLSGRGTMDPAEFKRRMETAVRIFDEAANSNHAFLVVNDTVMHAAHLIDDVANIGVQKLLESGDHDLTSQQHAKQLARELLERTKALLASL
ncbi:MAG TPA: hypothetical protein VLA92_03220 [Candidatus Saccharimonadales bacterium]|nr:hypothetical protein [Candidatus Saccharimonadales bacterium]